MWKGNWANKKNIPTMLSGTVKCIITKKMKEVSPNVTQVLSILLTAAATSASVEIGNSALRQVKTDFHSMMGEERLNALLLAYFIAMHSSIMTK